MEKFNFAMCPHCDKVANNKAKVEELFGLRTMGDGVIRVQSWCKECR